MGCEVNRFLLGRNPSHRTEVTSYAVNRYAPGPGAAPLGRRGEWFSLAVSRFLSGTTGVIAARCGGRVLSGDGLEGVELGGEADARERLELRRLEKALKVRRSLDDVCTACHLLQ